MKFSNDAMRDVLLFIEKKQQYNEDEEDKRLSTYTIDMIVDNSYFNKALTKNKYSKDELRYTIEKMIDGNILKISGSLTTFYEITEITFNGVQLLDAIRPETIWEKTKSIANNVGNHTLKYLEDTAQKIAVTATATFIESISK